MSRTRPLITYANQQYIPLVQRVLDTEQPFLVPCTKAQAASLRGELYAWRRACEKERAEGLELGIPVDALRTIAWRITSHGLETIPASMLVGPGLIEKALGGTDPILSPAQAALKGLMGKLGEGTHGA